MDNFFTKSKHAEVSEDSDFKNFSLLGVVKKRSFTIICVP